MKKILFLFFFIGCWLGMPAQQIDVFDRAEELFPEIPHGLLRAISLTNTQGHHLTDADYSFDMDDPSAMPRAYGMMGLVKDGKGCFRENLHLVAKLSGIPEDAILADPETNVKAYAKAMVKVAQELCVRMDTPESCVPIIQRLSELPLREEKDGLPMKMMLYSVYHHLGCDLKSLFKEDYGMLSSVGLSFSKETDYPQALWVPAPECNYEERVKPVSGVVIHYTEGSYAGCISWFQNCDSQVSSHYVIRSFDGQVTQMVRECDKAWHARSANGYTIGVEHEAYGDIESFFTEAMYSSSSSLIRDICSRYESIDGHRTFYFDTLDNGMALTTGLHDLGGEDACVKIRGHQHYPNQAHTDPGPYWDWNYYYKRINEGTPVTYLGGAIVNEGIFNHLNYGDDERRIWVIQSAVNTTITLTFSSFDLEKDHDFLWIYDGSNVYAPKIGRWNTRSPGTVTSSGNTLCVEFRSDCATGADGWNAMWTVNHTGVSSEESLDVISVHPNPVTDQLIVELPGEGVYEIQVFNVMGHIVFQSQKQETFPIDVSNWPRGVYVLRCSHIDNGRRCVERIIH